MASFSTSIVSLSLLMEIMSAQQILTVGNSNFAFLKKGHESQTVQATLMLHLNLILFWAYVVGLPKLPQTRPNKAPAYNGITDKFLRILFPFTA